ncbi:hypothetical protein K505DRAFT_326142 [Melanomma pulvis-pyrius CBS 109.77]|uniref:Alpha/beta-hydrolase n=1 Tax=Melanomma pulvis-pyrius CBS 109.77 TaxID=1314802 RepID=A0A6A6X7S5_9PLEO|nr:hypothetical protein K505DRAFT_326142 [Melanomma pulvis-pyrius CBS 109.77]
MAEPALPIAAAHSGPHSALADIQFASHVDADLTPSEDEITPEEQALELETLQSAIGVSIGHQQTRLTSPKTPAAEKAAALDEAEGGGLFDDGTIEQSAPQPIPVKTAAQSTERASPTQRNHASPPQHEAAARLPSPWRASPKIFTRVDDHRSALRDSLTAGSRRRALSGSSATDALRKYMPFNLPSMPKTSNFLSFSLPSFSVPSFDNTRGRPPPDAAYQRKRVTSMCDPSIRVGGIVQNDGSHQSKGTVPRRNSRRRSRSVSRPRHATTAPIPQRQFAEPAQGSNPEAPRPSQDLHRRPTAALRRSNSEGSLLLYRSKSWASSLGDDSRFEHVQEQVNSRLKAIKDSWQDANFKLPSMPTMPNFSFGSRDDMFKSNKNASTTPKGFNSDAMHNNRVSFLANSNSSSRGASVKLPRTKGSSTDITGMASGATSHPFFTQALHDLTGDVVILGGYRGSILRSAEAPHRQLWVPLKVGFNLRKVDLELGLNPEDEETEEQRIIPDGMLTHIGPVDIAKRLFKRLRASENARKGSLHVHNYGYDWRLSPHILSRRLIEYLKSLPCNQPGVPREKRGAIIIAHSLGGLITRHAINQHPELIAGVVYAGVPQNCINILGPLRNGDDVLLSSRVLTAQVNFTIRTSFALLPLDGKCFINKYTKEEYPLDFFDVNTWTEHCLSPVVSNPLPAPNQTTASNLSVSGLLNAMSQALPSLPSRKSSMSKGTSTPNSPGLSYSTNPNPQSSAPSSGALRDLTRNAAERVAEGSSSTAGVTPQMSNTHKVPNSSQEYSTSQTNPATTVTLPFDKAHAYLTRTLAEMKTFKQALGYNPELGDANRYPPIALIYGKSTPTVYGAKVESKEAIKRLDCYDELAFASGDGVVLAKAAMVPSGYSVVRGGVVSSDRGHVTLLGDLEAVGRCLNAVLGARANGVGLGTEGKGKGKAEA